MPTATPYGARSIPHEGVASTLPPGPALPRTLQAVLWARRFPQFVRHAHERYGPTFTARLGQLPTSVVTVDRDAIQRLFTGDPLLKRHANDLVRPILGDRSVLLLEPGEHLERRKLLLPPFHGERVRRYAELMHELIDDELDHWRVGEEVRVLPRAQNLTLEVILQAVLGIRDAAMREQLREIYDAMVGVPLSDMGFYFPRLTRRSRWRPTVERFWRRKDELDQLVTAHISATREDPRLDEREDVLALLVQARDEGGGGLTDAELLAELNTLLVAGHETTAAAVAWGAELLARDMAVLERTRGAMDGGETEYLEALVKEVLRIRPPLPGCARHPVEPFPIGDFVIDPEVAIIVNAWGVHHDPAIYPEPQRLRPERFLEAAPDSYTFLTFGGGAHRCLGAALAQLEVKIVLSAIVDRFDLRAVRKEIAPAVRRGLSFVPRGGGRVRVEGAGVRRRAASSASAV
jgi:cytochrome P450